jgi:hypothetical protein
MLPRRMERMAGISELAGTQDLASLEHEPRPVRQCLRAVGQEEPRRSEQVGVAEQASERAALFGEQTRGAVPSPRSHRERSWAPEGRRTPRPASAAQSRELPGSLEWPLSARRSSRVQVCPCVRTPWPMPVRRPVGKSLGKSNVPVIRSKRLHLQAFCDAGGGTRTPDTRIMIPLL